MTTTTKTTLPLLLAASSFRATMDRAALLRAHAQRAHDDAEARRRGHALFARAAASRMSVTPGFSYIDAVASFVERPHVFGATCGCGAGTDESPFGVPACAACLEGIATDLEQEAGAALQAHCNAAKVSP